MAPAVHTVAAPAVPAAPTARRPLDLRAITLSGGDLLGDWQRLNREATIPHCIERLETTGVMDNLRRLVGESDAEFRGPLFADSDLYKTLEAIGWEAVRTGSTEFDPFVDEAVRLLTDVQEPDGYLDSYYQGPHAGERFTDLPQGHELYKLGHLVQAAIAFAYAGRDDLLALALRYVELVHTTFGEGARGDLDGHPEIETALVELSRLTGDPRHRELARRMVELRGHRTIGEGAFGGAYYQDLVPVKEAREATGHAVRQLYLLAGVADLELDDPASGYADTLDALWHDVHEKKLYVTGGLGSRHRGEAFGDPYELPADRAYSETCAAIANLHWNWRMLLRGGDARFADEMERGLYNAIAVSTSVDGRSYFYSNPLQLRTGHDHEEDAPSTRLDWYNCACCPPNLARLLSSITAYLATETDDAVQLHLYATGEIALGDGVTATVRTELPWDGRVEISLDGPAPKALELRIPAWAEGATLAVDGGEPQEAAPANGYARVEAGARSIVLELPVTTVIETAHPWVDAARGTVAVRRGPVYYALESADLPEGLTLEDVVLPADPRPADGGWDDALGVPVLAIEGASRRPAAGALYAARGRASGAGSPGAPELGALRAIPYFRWANRAPGAMRVWLPTS
ncbi:glycoside hydrolase family 127 protein [Herbiconiux moechotypicola]|uniref:Glycoside hydrolase family 127 protein n=1 Tax=Herbiconiux moechotypicola TaxID=637393 RepID=A0ABN3DAK6_9MICO|nr:beta-L-arabinofuranosidase domain-containing protein [Herbiconiux moechotypicola]MCS5728993.1 glycoside hydrolase family 127 protein [Herbiconiux moechotypicola]